MSELAVHRARGPRVGAAHPPDRLRPVAGKRIAAGYSPPMILAVLSPIAEKWRARPHDSFPLSY